MGRGNFFNKQCWESNIHMQKNKAKKNKKKTKKKKPSVLEDRTIGITGSGRERTKNE